MAENVKVKVFGVKEVLSRMERIELANNPDVKILLKNMGSKVKADTKKRTPVDSGDLRKSWSYRIKPNGWSVEVTSDKEYAPAVEFGTKTGQGAFKPGVRMLNKSVSDMKNIYLKTMVDDFYKKLKREYEK